VNLPLEQTRVHGEKPVSLDTTDVLFSAGAHSPTWSPSSG
jgi:hypothetical protein